MTWLFGWILSFFQDFSLAILFGSLVVIVIANFFATVYRVAIIALATLTLCASVYLKGGADEKIKYEKRISDQAAEIAKLNTKRSKVTTKSASNHDVNRRLVEENGRLKDINEYLTNQEINTCELPDNFIRLHDDSATGKLSGARRKSDDSPAKGTIETTEAP